MTAQWCSVARIQGEIKGGIVKLSKAAGYRHYRIRDTDLDDHMSQADGYGREGKEK